MALTGLGKRDYKQLQALSNPFSYCPINIITVVKEHTTNAQKRK